MAEAQVVINEIHYHPVEQEAFNPDGTPVLDLTEDVHEFIELHNVGVGAVDVSGWQFSGINFTIPATNIIQPGGYLLIAKNPARIATVYGIAQASILGPYTGVMSNVGETITLRTSGGSTVDSVTYSSRFPWAIAADGLGETQKSWTLIDTSLYQYKGRSLERVSVTASSNDPANWLASPLAAGPSPGAANAVTRAAPKPVVTAFSVAQVSDGSATIRAGESVRVSCTFSATTGVTNVQTEYFIDNIESFSEPRTQLAMTALGNGNFTATLPGQGDRTVVRFRFLADRGDGLEPVSPRLDDALIVPVGPSAREGWHAYFVSPIRTPTVNNGQVAEQIYEIFVSSADLALLSTNISQSPRRISNPDPPGYPREEPYVLPTDPQWNGTRPAIFVHNGVVYDIQIRHHGSRYRRSLGRRDYKVKFPNFAEMDFVKSMNLTDKADQDNNGFAEDYRTILGHKLYREVGIPSSVTRFVDMYLNNDGVFSRLEQTDNDDAMQEHFFDEYHRRNPHLPKEEVGTIWKSKGTAEGPYGIGDGTQLPAKTAGALVPGGIWTPWWRYKFTYVIQNNDWVGAKPIEDLINGMWAARGDTPAAINPNIANVRAWAQQNIDIDMMLTSIALRNWAVPWDDRLHNYHLWRRANGKWCLTPWDFDTEFSSQSATGDVFNKNNYFKDTILRCFDAEYRQKMHLINNTLFTLENLESLGAFRMVDWRSWATQRFNSVNAQLGLGTFQRPVKPVNVGPAPGASALSPSSLVGSTYAHTNTGSPRPHAKSRWEMRTATGNYREPLFVFEGSSNLTSQPIPFDDLIFNQQYFWRVIYYDADGHPSLPSDESVFYYGPAPSIQNVARIDGTTTWKYDATSQFNDHTWTLPAFNDSAWAEGSPLFGADAGFDARFWAEPIRTPITLGSRSAFYFRKKFTLNGSPGGATFRLRHMIDDGMVLYVNGTEALRVNMDVGAVTYATPALIRVQDANVYSSFVNIPATAFVQGENTIAVEVHQKAADTTDMIMGLELEATLPFVLGDISLSEVMANNRQAVTNGGGKPDYIELRNTGSSPVDISGWSLSDDPTVPGKFTFPAGTSIGGGVFLVVWCDDEFSAPGLHTGFGLAASGQTVVLFQGTNIKDQVVFGPQAVDFPIGRLAGDDAWRLIAPSPNATNAAVALGSKSALRINEWLANPATGNDYFELYNDAAQPVEMSLLFLSDTPSQPQLSQIPPLSFIGPKGFTRFEADNDTGENHVNFGLSSNGDSIILTDNIGGATINSVTFGAQAQGVSQGRLTDGAAAIVSFPQTPTPGASNYLPTSIVINEALTNSTAPFEDAIELRNPTGGAVDIGGWFLSDDQSALKKFRIPDGISIGANDFRVFYENQFDAGANAFSLSSGGDELILSQADAGGNLTGFRQQVSFGAAAENVSFGRITTASEPEFWPLTARTFGQDSPATVEQFRTGTGAANATPKIGPLGITEIMYHPPDVGGADNARDEFIEVANVSGSALDVSGWRLKGDSDFTFAAGTTIAAQSYVLLVSFNPNDSATLNGFRANYGISAGIPIYGPYSPKLANSTADVELAYPGTAVGGVTPFINVEKVDYADAAPWPTAPDGGGSALKRTSLTAIGNDAANWTAATPTPGTGDALPSPPAAAPATTDADGDGLPDAWETAHGLNRLSAVDATRDDDADGFSNLAEFIAGTDPRDSADALRAELAKPASGVGIVIRFPAKAGRAYRIEFSESLGVSDWQMLIQIPARAYDEVVEHRDASGAAQRFYRVIAE